MNTIGVIGLGKLGLPFALLLSKYNQVIGYDKNSTVVNLLNHKISPYNEPQVQDLLINADRFVAVEDATQLRRASIVFIVVPTPSDSNGAFSNKYILAALEEIGKSCAELKTVVICSTVMPGSTSEILKPALDKAAGRNINVMYSPEFIALGSIVRDMQQPDMLLIGFDNDPAELWNKDLNQVIQIFQMIHTNTNKKPEVCIMGTKQAELAKIAINTYITMKIAYANTIGSIASRMGIKSDKILNAVGSDGRIGKKYLKSGPSFGGPCFPRDTVAFARVARTYNVSDSLAKATDEINEQRVNEIVHKILEHEGPYGLVGVSYKENTDVLDCSPTLRVAQSLWDRYQTPVYLYDPLMSDGMKDHFGEGSMVADDLIELFNKTKTIFVFAADDNLKTQLLTAKNNTIINCWGMF